jgi:hypothetical protein
MRCVLEVVATAHAIVWPVLEVMARLRDVVGARAASSSRSSTS